MNLPNKITLSRICMIPVFVAVFYCGYLSEWCFLASAGVFLLAALTDALDGHIARSRNLVTNLGKFLDPIADKVLVSTAFIVMLTIPTAFSVYPFGEYGVMAAGICIALILARELIVSGFRIIAAGRNLVLAADKLGKIKTTLQDVAIAFLLVSMSFVTKTGDMKTAGEIIAYIGLVCFVLCTILTVVSGVNYLIKNKEVLKG
ncbi:MAG: CDP-diacylglycerol--glycerol-3-phosphate 3-phosphatidyltransferase [Clostridia bacterium]|nr:CDP-diacylglycerol--glycerol-3-phosphate 3-phosphatidyltransferase [Clostridia bacterium]MDE6676352.1 CDP-diacylglycerol--glycerol-3-phosphate 3-phosphatidyltransferase [Clostridia bacterium]